jgi:glycosyltransferase involved in cell wall biosynthesis
LTRAWAELLTTAADPVILSTCAKDYTTWADHYPPGHDRVGNVDVLRFPVDTPRDQTAFDAASSRLQELGPGRITGADGDDWQRLQGPVSTALVEHLAATDYDAVIFVGYLYAQTWMGLARCRSRTWLAPCAHDEWCLRFPFWHRVFGSAGGLLYLSDWERGFLRRRFPTRDLDGPVVGAPIQPPAHVKPARFRRQLGFDRPYVLYLGRIDISKGCGMLFHHYVHAVEADPSLPDLVVCGQSVMEVPRHPRVHATGFVDDSTRWDALAGCAALINPSPYESLSLAVLEAWTLARPTLVYADCQVLVEQTQRSGGGTWWREMSEFVPRLAEAMALGPAKGAQAWTQARYGPAAVAGRLCEALGVPPDPDNGTPP